MLLLQMTDYGQFAEAEEVVEDFFLLKVEDEL